MVTSVSAIYCKLNFWKIQQFSSVQFSTFEVLTHLQLQCRCVKSANKVVPIAVSVA